MQTRYEKTKTYPELTRFNAIVLNILFCQRVRVPARFHDRGKRDDFPVPSLKRTTLRVLSMKSLRNTWHFVFRTAPYLDFRKLYRWRWNILHENHKSTNCILRGNLVCPRTFGFRPTVFKTYSNFKYTQKWQISCCIPFQTMKAFVLIKEGSLHNLKEDMIP